MAGHVATTVQVERFLDEYGTAWCNDCRLPSGVRTWFAVRFGLRMHLKPVLWCHDCGGQNVTDDQSAA